MHAEQLLLSIRVLSLVLIAQAVSLAKRGQTDKQTNATERSTHAGVPVAYDFCYTTAHLARAHACLAGHICCLC